MLIRFIFLPFLIFTSFAASAALTTVPLREVWALATDDVVSVNTVSKTATATAYLPNASGTIYRIKATTNGVRLLTIAEEAAVGGKGNPWLTAALAAGYLTYEGYQWYKTTQSSTLVDVGLCGGMGSALVTLADCKIKIAQYVVKMYSFDKFVPDVNFTSQDPQDSSGLIKFYYTVSAEYGPSSTWSGSWTFKEKIQGTSEDKEPVTDNEVSDFLLNSLSSASSRAAFSEGNMPYPLDGLFTDSDLSVDPTYSPQADITTENLPDYITKYNNNTLQTTDPSLSNYVTPAQYQYIKSQAEQAAATAAGGSTSTNPLEGMEQPITQKQYDESNAKTDEAAANNIKSTDWTGVDTASKGGDGANDALDKMAKGIDPTLPVLLVPDFPAYSSCKTIDLTWNGYAAVFPTQSQCAKMEEFKLNLGYFLYLITAVGIIMELLRRVE